MTKEFLKRANILEEQIRRLTIALEEFENELTSKEYLGIRDFKNNGFRALCTSFSERTFENFRRNAIADIKEYLVSAQNELNEL